MKAFEIHPRAPGERLRGIRQVQRYDIDKSL
jgi:hypothetical protein